MEPEVAAALDRLEAIDPEIMAFVDEPDRRARLEREPPPSDGPLRAVPVAVKDLYRVDGLPTRGGSAVPAWVFEGPESHVVRELKRLGASILGKTTTDEFAYSEPPPTRNPRDLRRIPGGSSSGSAAAVAAGICAFAVGSQTLQSVIVPASYCGVVGYRATYDRLPFDGLNLASSIDTVGFFAPSVRELRAFVSPVLPGWRDVGDAEAPVLGVPRPWHAPDPDLVGWVGHARHVAAIGAADIQVRPASTPWDEPDALETWDRTIGELLHGEMALAHEPWFDRYVDRYRPASARGVRLGRDVSLDRLRECRTAPGTLAEGLVEAAARAGIDAWTCPSTADVAPLRGEPFLGPSMTYLWSTAGLPAVSLPVFDGPDGLPLGVQLIGLPGRDEELLAIAERVEDAVASSIEAEA
jgi:Asp-tRNA(Asn)/Glu-tRNA(Gln) amidotransferase A subunit family amidase